MGSEVYAGGFVGPASKTRYLCEPWEKEPKKLVMRLVTIAAYSKCKEDVDRSELCLLEGGSKEMRCRVLPEEEG